MSVGGADDGGILPAPIQLVIQDRYDGSGQPFKRRVWAGYDLLEWIESVERDPALLAHARTGEFRDAQGEPLPELDATILRAKLLDADGGVGYADTPEDGWGIDIDEHEMAEADRWLITGLWKWGDHPVMGGPAKSGKGVVARDLATTLLVPDHLFLGRWPVDPQAFAEISDDEIGKGPGVVVVNAENYQRRFEAALARAGLGNHWIKVMHLRDLGGARTFDIRDPVLWAQWAARLTRYNNLDRSDAAATSPRVVIVDGLTAIVGNDFNAYGDWISRWRDLCDAVGIPNSLTTAHTTQKGDHLMGGVAALGAADGNWYYAASNPDDPTSKRHFWTSPRDGGGDPIPRTRVILGPNGEPVVHVTASTDKRHRNAAPAPGEFLSDGPAPKSWAEADEAFLGAVAALNDEGVEPGFNPVFRRLIDQGVPIAKKTALAARDRLIAAGALVNTSDRGPHAYRATRTP